jgi:hypothetical protein
MDIAGLSVNHGLLSLRRNIALFMLGHGADEIYPKEAVFGIGSLLPSPRL